VTGDRLDGWEVQEYGRSGGGIPLRVFLPDGDGPVDGLLTAAQHGEEADTALLARRLLERVPASASRWAVIPCLNPDGLLSGTRQNAAGVDLNRNFPASTWRSRASFTYPPGIAPARRVPANRTNRSSPGAHAGSEPETKALMALVERLQPPLVVDLHSPLELLFVRGDVPPGVTDGLARSADLPAQLEFDGLCPGAFDDWLVERGVPVLVYEVEHAGLPALCERHLPGLEALLRRVSAPVRPLAGARTGGDGGGDAGTRPV
jgi:protein MpaA